MRLLLRERDLSSLDLKTADMHEMSFAQKLSFGREEGKDILQKPKYKQKSALMNL